MTISNNIASIGAHQTMMNTNANNVANVNTDGFVPSDTTITSNTQNTPQANVSLSDDNGSLKSQTDLSKELPQQINIQAGVEANVASIKTQDDILGSLLDIKA